MISYRDVIKLGNKRKLFW